MIELGYIDRTIGLYLNHYRNNPDIREWCRQTGLIDDKAQEKWYNWQSEDPNTEMFLIKDENKIAVGVCGLTSIDHIARKAEFSCYIFVSEQRKGYCKEALKILFAYGFDSLNLNLIWGETFESNPALKLFLSLGMKEEGIRRSFYYKEGKYINAHLVSILKDEFQHDE